MASSINSVMIPIKNYNYISDVSSGFHSDTQILEDAYAKLKRESLGLSHEGLEKIYRLWLEALSVDSCRLELQEIPALLKLGVDFFGGRELSVCAIAATFTFLRSMVCDFSKVQEEQCDLYYSKNKYDRSDWFQFFISLSTALDLHPGSARESLWKEAGMSWAQENIEAAAPGFNETVERIELLISLFEAAHFKGRHFEDEEENAYSAYKRTYKQAVFQIALNLHEPNMGLKFLSASLSRHQLQLDSSEQWDSVLELVKRNSHDLKVSVCALASLLQSGACNSPFNELVFPALLEKAALEEFLDYRVWQFVLQLTAAVPEESAERVWSSHFSKIAGFLGRLDMGISEDTALQSVFALDPEEQMKHFQVRFSAEMKLLQYVLKALEGGQDSSKIYFRFLKHFTFLDFESNGPFLEGSWNAMLHLFGQVSVACYTPEMTQGFALFYALHLFRRLDSQNGARQMGVEFLEAVRGVFRPDDSFKEPLIKCLEGMFCSLSQRWQASSLEDTVVLVTALFEGSEDLPHFRLRLALALALGCRDASFGHKVVCGELEYYAKEHGRLTLSEDIESLLGRSLRRSVSLHSILDLHDLIHSSCKMGDKVSEAFLLGILETVIEQESVSLGAYCRLLDVISASKLSLKSRHPHEKFVTAVLKIVSKPFYVGDLAELDRYLEGHSLKSHRLEEKLNRKRAMLAVIFGLQEQVVNEKLSMQWMGALIPLLSQMTCMMQHARAKQSAVFIKGRRGGQFLREVSLLKKFSSEAERLPFVLYKTAIYASLQRCYRHALRDKAQKYQAEHLLRTIAAQPQLTSDPAEPRLVETCEGFLFITA